MTAAPEQLFGRKASLIVAAGTDGLDLSQMHFRFKVTNSDNETPNTATIRIYNLSEDTVRKITGNTPVEFTRVILQAGYENGPFGVIFDGTIKQFRKGKENATDKYLDILAAIGDPEYNFGICHATIDAGSTPQQRVKIVAGQMGLGVLGVNQPRKPTQADVAAQQAKVDAAKAALDAQVAKNLQLVAKVNALLAQYTLTPTPDLKQQLLAAQADMNNANAEAHAVQEPAYAQAVAALNAITAAANAPDLPGLSFGGTLPRGKVLWGMGRALMRCEALNVGASWSVQDGQVTVVPLDGYLPGEAVVLNSRSGMVGIPEQTEQGIKVRCLLNPKLRIAGLIQIDNTSINQTSQADLRASGFATRNLQVGQIPFDKYAGVQMIADVSSDGFYRLYVVEYAGDTRGQDWYADCIGLAVDTSTGKVLAP